ncbi:MAG: hypothetical protein K2X32_10835 [Phycisphaerales bacterium]|nr:hypothetical protein [Phycisphaerales bacterium]
MLSKYQVRGVGVAASPLVIVLVVCLLSRELGDAMWAHVIDRGLLQCAIAIVFLLGIGGYVGHLWGKANSPSESTSDIRNDS